MKTFRKKQNYYDNNEYQNKGTPKSEDDGKMAIGLSTKSIKDLPKSSLTFAVDPYTATMPHAVPYNIINTFNPKVGGSYAGDNNLDGGNVQQYANSTRSGLLKAFDFCRMKLDLNYRYLPITPREDQCGYGLVDEMIKALDEATSLLGATTFTQLAVNDYVVETDLVMGSAQPEVMSGKQVYTRLAEVLYATFIYYQTYLQNICNSYTWHNSFRLKQGTMIRSSYNRETPILNSLFGLFNKKSWLNLLEGIALSLEGEYIDHGFVKQSAMLNAVPSRRSDAILDPVMEIQTKFRLPTKLKIWLADKGEIVGTKPIFDSDVLSDSISAVDMFNDFLAAENIMSWARSYEEYTDTTANAYFNQTREALEKITSGLYLFKAMVSDFREVLDIMTRTGTVAWAKNYKPVVTPDTSASIPDVLLVNDIYRLAFSGSPSVKFENETKRWRTFSLWNMYTGIPEYDARQGGSFLTFSCKDLDIDFDDDDNRMYLPVGFNYDEANGPVCYITARDGVTGTITTEPLIISNDPVLARLAPLDSQSSLAIRVPTVLFNDKFSFMHKSLAYKLVVQIFGLGQVQLTADDVTDLGLDPDFVSIYQIEIEDFTNMAINYARTNAPFRASARDTSFLGFWGTGMTNTNQ